MKLRKHFGKKLKRRKEKPNLNFSNIRLSKYFSALLNSEDNRDIRVLKIITYSIDTMTQSLIDETLNCEISLEEVKQMAEILKNRKAEAWKLKFYACFYHTLQQISTIW